MEASTADMTLMWAKKRIARAAMTNMYSRTAIESTMPMCGIKLTSMAMRKAASKDVDCMYRIGSNGDGLSGALNRHIAAAEAAQQSESTARVNDVSRTSRNSAPNAMRQSDRRKDAKTIESRLAGRLFTDAAWSFLKCSGVGPRRRDPPVENLSIIDQP